MKRAAILLTLILAVFSLGSGAPRQLALINGTVLTLELEPGSADRPPTAVFIVGDRIEAVGSFRDIEALLTPATEVIDLGGKTVVPGFVDAHSHFPASGLAQLGVDLQPPPSGTVRTRDDLLDRMAEQAKLADGTDWLVGFNYDNTVFADGRHPSRAELDGVSKDRPVYLWHNSGHMGVANSQALTELSLNAATAPVAGGQIGRDAVSGELNGLLQERAAPPMSWLLGKLSRRKLLGVIATARDQYLAAGITTVQNGYAGSGIVRVLQWLHRAGYLPQRVVVWPAHAKLGSRNPDDLPRAAQRQSSGLHSGAIKMIVDGSPQGLTAYLTKDYLRVSPGEQTASGFRGFPSVTQLMLTAKVLKWHRAGHQLALHGNGDAAIDMILDALETAQDAHPREDARHLVVHAQTVRRDQLLRMQELQVGASFFAAHTYFWGDWHRSVGLGETRAADISPTGWANELGVSYSLHADTPVTAMWPMHMIWTATERRTRSGHLLGAHQRITRLRALRALTIDAAWQNHLEHDRGSVEPGKLADLVVLSDNPLEVDDVRQVYVERTIIGGVEHYVRHR